MTGDHTTQFYHFHDEAEALAFLEAMKHKGVHVRHASVAPDPEAEGVILAVEATSAD